MLTRNRQDRADAYRADMKARIDAATEEARRRRPQPPSREPQA
jgi:hypothetical protein